LAAVPAGDAASCEPTPTELFQARSLAGECPFDPHRGDRSPRWIFPNLIDSSTSCRALVLAPAWNAA
jgi:hypothetical protein